LEFKKFSMTKTSSYLKPMHFSQIAAGIRKAARSLRISQTALLNKMKKYGIMMEKG